MKLYSISNPRLGKARNLTQTTSAKAKDVARSTSKNVRSTSKSVRHSVQDTFASAKDTVQLAYAQVRKSTKVGWSKTLVWLTTAAAIADAFIQENKRKAQKNLKKAQKNMQKAQGPLQSNVRASLAKASEAIGKSTSQAQYGLKQATTRAKEVQESWQEQSARRQRKRKRARMVFRWGFIAGVALALLYSPIAGSEVRQRIGKGWQQSSTYFRNRRQGVPA